MEDLFRNTKTNRNKRLHFSTPIPPSVNAMYTMRKQLTSTAQKYIRVSRALINEAIEEQHWKVPQRDTWVYVDMVFYFPDRKIRDASNCLKLLLDVMQDIVYVNDYWALPRIQSVEYDKENPRVEVTVSHQMKIEREKGLKMTHV
jgi:crossover junction endodeoxyribonuclease RusA